MHKPSTPRPKKGAPYPAEFRSEAVQYWISSGKSAKEIAAELGVTDWSLNHWRKQIEEIGTTPDQPSSSASADSLELAREVGRLRKELESMTRQRDILKKAISIFSNDDPKAPSR